MLLPEVGFVSLWQMVTCHPQSLKPLIRVGHAETTHIFACYVSISTSKSTASGVCLILISTEQVCFTGYQKRYIVYICVVILLGGLCPLVVQAKSH